MSEIPVTPAAIERIEAAGIVPVVRLQQREGAFETCEALRAGGMTCIEVTTTTPGAVDLIGACVERFGDAVLIGAGSVTDVKVASAVLEAGARFVVSPVFPRGAFHLCRDHDIPMIPGALTPNEIMDAWRAGAPLVKVFPAVTFGPRYIKDLRGPLPFLKLMPTGGVNLTTIPEFIAAGAAALAAGGELVDKDAVARGDFAAITGRAREFVEAVRAARSA
jgi:2-dehydro-3-deoxyphosphogluconate aldolase/(4S)-4-hydroxy-2-oxoglutarate aldolase